MARSCPCRGASSSKGRQAAVLVASIVPLLFTPVAALPDFFSFPHGVVNDLFGDASRPALPAYESKISISLMNGNDAGLPGNVGIRIDREDTESANDIRTGIENGSGSFAEDRNMKTAFAGKWELVSLSSGVSAMHMQLLPNNKALVFDSTAFGPSPVGLPPKRPCVWRNMKNRWTEDCTAHAVVYDIETAAIRPLTINTDPWCSSGGLGPDGTLVSTGGWGTGGRSVRFLSPCDNCDWKDMPYVLGGGRWYATQIMLPGGNFIVFGGRRSYSYEYIPVNSKVNRQAIPFPFLEETTDLDENNLYPFVYLLPDGTLFVFANSRSVILDLKTNRIVKEFPRLKGGSRNYPASGMSALLPMTMPQDEGDAGIVAEVIVCGGNKAKAYRIVERSRVFLPALMDCGRLVATDWNADWKREKMPSARVMGDLLILPTGDLLMLNGAHNGTSAWNFAADPNYVPALYSPDKPAGTRFRELQSTTIPRMYHSSSMVLPDGRILVGGSNTNPGYLFRKGRGVQYPTELRMEKFSPPYLDPALTKFHPRIVGSKAVKKLTYRSHFNVEFIVNVAKATVDRHDLKVTLYAPPFTTHGYSMNQRLLVLAITGVIRVGQVQLVGVRSPPSAAVAPPGYYLVFVMYKGLPSVGTWVHIQ